MKITEVKFRRVFNLGNYETIAIELTADVGTSNHMDVLEDLEEEVNEYYSENRKEKQT